MFNRITRSRPETEDSGAKRSAVRPTGGRTTSYAKDMDGAPGRDGEQRTTSFSKPLQWNRGGYTAIT